MTKSEFRIGLLCAFSILLASCGSAPKRTQTAEVRKPVQSTQETPTYKPDYYLSEARNAYARTGDIRLRNQWILKAAEAFKEQGQCLQSEKILALSVPELVDTVQLTHASVIKAECLISRPETDFAQLEKLMSRVTPQAGYSERIETIRAQLHIHQKNWLAAARSTFLGNLGEPEKTNVIWTLLQNLDYQQLENARSQEPLLQPWLQLTLITHRFGLDPENLSLAVQEWQTRFPSHPLSIALPPAILTAMVTVPHSANKIAVLLPFTGRLANQGKAIKDGILAAYMDRQRFKSINGEVEDEVQQIQFFDTALHTSEELSQFVEEFDFVIGPLLKDKIAELLALLPEDKPVLSLNRINLPSPEMRRDNQYFFALAPEDEAEQLVDKVLASGAKHPILVAADSTTTRRMADAFANKWLASHESGTPAPKVAIFDSTKTLRTGITELLDVAQSKSRIKQIEGLVSKELHSVPRNRRDIDAIIVFANPEQTELLNPIIESSLSPFTDKSVPVFASSRSYSLDLNKNSLRDLRNLTFSDMPWMLPEHPWQALERQSATLWPQRKDTLRRLFAMGYDGYSLLPNLLHLKTMPHLSVQGLTGELSLTENGEITRKLPYGYVDNDEVILIALD